MKALAAFLLAVVLCATAFPTASKWIDLGTYGPWRVSVQTPMIGGDYDHEEEDVDTGFSKRTMTAGPATGAYILTAWDVNCKTRQVRIVMETAYTEDDEYLESQSYKDKMTTVPDGTLAAEFFKNWCPEPTKPIDKHLPKDLVPAIQ